MNGRHSNTLRQIRPLRARVRARLYISFSIWVIASFAAAYTQAQGRRDAWIDSVFGDVSRYRMTSGSVMRYSVAKNDSLDAGDEIQTGSNGRTVIGLADGSQVLVHPNSKIKLKDLRSASSARDLLEIVFGRVRISIQHYGNRPNPCRVNTPTASIAVRGTVFDVEYGPTHETQVSVIEGLVDVTSTARPDRTEHVQAGRTVIVRPDGDITFIAKVLEQKLNVRNSWAEESRNPVVGVNGAYQRYIDSVIENSGGPFISRFTAFGDAHLDSLENPAYAGDFNRGEGRVYLLPSVSNSPRDIGGSASASPSSGLNGSRPIDYTLAPQGSFFIPKPSWRTVFGGAVSVTHTSLEAFTLDDRLVDQQNGLAELFTINSGLTRLTAVNTSLIAARRFGETGRTSLGIEVDHLGGTGSLTQTLSFLGGLEQVTSQADLNRTRFTIGLAHDFSGGRKLGLFYRYGVVSADDHDRQRTFDEIPLPLDFRLTSTHSSEIGIRWRSPITRRLFYGLEGSLVDEHLNQTTHSNGADDHELDTSRRLAVGGGLGFALTPRTVFSVDVSGGIRRTSRLSDFSQREHGSFWSINAGGQTDIWRQSFVSASYLRVDQTNLTFDALLEPGVKPAFDSLGRQFGSFGAGWRFKNNLIAEYVFSSDFGRTAPTHAILLRYTFSLSREK